MLDPGDLDLCGRNVGLFEALGNLMPGAAPRFGPAGHPRAADGAVHEQNLGRFLRVAGGNLLEHPEDAISVRHPQGDEHDLAVFGGPALRVQRLDLLQCFSGGAVVELGRLVLAAAIEAAVFAFIPVVRGHFGQRRQAGAFLFFPLLARNPGSGQGNPQDNQSDFQIVSPHTSLRIGIRLAAKICNRKKSPRPWAGACRKKALSTSGLGRRRAARP